MSLENKFNDFKTKHNLDDNAIAELLKIFNDSFIELAHKLLSTESTFEYSEKIPKNFNGTKKFATKIASEYATEHGLTLDDFNKEKITKKDIDEIVKSRIKTIPKLNTTPKETNKTTGPKIKCCGLTKNGEPCNKDGTENPDGSKNWFCFRHAVDWKNYEISSDSELEEEQVFKNPVSD